MHINQTYSLLSFSYACSSGIPQPACKVNIEGYKYDRPNMNGPRYVYESVVYPKVESGHSIGDLVMNSTKGKMVFGKEWTGLTYLKWSIEREVDGGDMVGAFVLDDFEYTVETTSGTECWAEGVNVTTVEVGE